METKTILITGAAGGIGRDTAIALAKKGHKVIATTHRQEQVNTLKEYGQSENVQLEVFKLDITLEKDRQQIVDYDLDVLINNAATGESGSLAEIPVDKLRHNFEVNVFSTLALSQLALRGMMKKDSGRIVFISSLGGRIVMPFLASYSMTKFALSAGAEALRQELKKVTKNVHITLVEPGAYHTGFNQKNMARKYEWMDESSYFSGVIDEIRQEEERNFEFLEVKSLDSIVDKIVTAAETKKPALRYTAPWWQAAGTQVLRMGGK